METRIPFDLAHPDYSVRQLSVADAPAVRRLFEKCVDYFLIVDGQAPAALEAEEEFHDLPPGKSLDDKFMLGIVSRQADLVGLLEGVCHYPDEGTWWIGLFLLAPEVRGLGLGRQVVQAFAEYVRSGGGEAIMLGVVADNVAAYQFWTKIGFEQLRVSEPRLFGQKTQTVSVLWRPVTVPSAEE